MATLEEFKALRDGVPAEVQAELYRLFTADPEASFKRMVEIAAENDVTTAVDEVNGFLKQIANKRICISLICILPTNRVGNSV